MLRVITNIFSEIQDFLSYKGEWDFRTVYAEGDLVSYIGNIYTAKTPINQSSSSVVIGHDDFQRANTLDGWGTASDGTPWVVTFEAMAGTAVILSNKGVIQSGDSGTTIPRAALQFGNTELPTENVEILIKFSVTGTQDWNLNANCRSDSNGTTELNLAITSDTTDLFFQDALTFLDGVDTSTEQINDPNTLPLTSGVNYLLRIQASGFQFATKIWQASQTEPTDWDIINNSDIVTLGNFFSFFFVAYGSVFDTVLKFSEFTIRSLPTPPDTNTNSWLLIG